MKRAGSFLVVMILIGTLQVQAFDFVSKSTSRYAFTLQTPSGGIQGLQLLMMPPANKTYKAHIHVQVINAPSRGVSITIKDSDGNILASGTGVSVNGIVEANLNAPGTDGNTTLKDGEGVLVDISGDAQVYIFIDAVLVKLKT